MEETGVNVEWQYSPDNDHTKLNVLIASGELPDIIYTNDDLPQIRQLAEYDRIWALNELAEKYDSKFMDYIDDHVLLAKRLKWDSMNLYALPTGFTGEAVMDKPYIVKNLSGVTVIDKIYEEMGSPEIKTVDDYLNLLRKVKKAYPDMIPMQSSRSSSRDHDGNPRLVFKALPIAGLTGRFYKDGDAYKKYWEHPNFLELLKFLNTCYNEDLIDKTEFTDETGQLRTKLYSGRVFSEMNQDADNIDWYTGEVQKVHPDWGWIMIDAPGLNENVPYENDTFHGGGPSKIAILVSKDTKHPERIIRWFEFLMSDQTQREIIFGLEGNSYSVENGVPVVFPEVMDFYNTDQDEAKLKYGLEAYWLFRNNNYASMKRLLSATERQQKAHEVSGKYYKDFSFFRGIESYASDSEEIKLVAEIKEYYSVEIMRIIMADPSEVEPIYNNMIAKMKEMGLDTLNAYWTQALNNKEAAYAEFSKDLK
jgi:putative aldouronate transport system substrate-binding protein